MKLFSVQAVKFRGRESNCVIDGNVGWIGIRNQLMFRIRFKVISSDFPYSIMFKDKEYKLDINDNGKIEFSVWDGVDWYPSVVGCNVVCDEWYDVVCIVNSGVDRINKTIYVNDIDNKFEDISQDGSVVQTSNPLVIGDSEIVVDNVMFWYRILSEDEIESIFDGDLVFNRLGFWLAFEDIDVGESTILDSAETYDVLRKRYKGVLSNIEIVDGKELEYLKRTKGKVVVVKRY